MSEQAKKTRYLIFGILLSVLLVTTGILLMASCVSIYKIGHRPFTPENISAAFSKIAFPVGVTAGMSIVGLLMNVIFPYMNPTPKARKDQKRILCLLQKRLNTETCPKETLDAIQKERHLRAVLRIAATVLSVAAALPAVIYSLNMNHFSADYNESVIAACMWILPCTFIVMGICTALVYIEGASYERQLRLVKAALAESKKSASAEAPDASVGSQKGKTALRISLAVAAILLIVIGILNGGMAEVLDKAVNICTECIGLG